MAKNPLEYAQIKQPNTLEMYIEKLSSMNKRTLLKYDLRWNSLLARESNEDLASKLKSVISRAINDINTLKIKPSTFRVYKAAICYGLASTFLKIENDLIDENEYENGLTTQLLSSLYKEITNEKVKYCKSENYKIQTSAMKKKSFPESFYIFLKTLIKTEKNNPRFLLMHQFVEANLIVGLRPIEWMDIKITSDVSSRTMVLFVTNAKNSNGRANGEVRELFLSEATQEDQIKILGFYINFQNKLSISVEHFLKEQAVFENQNEFLTRKQSHIFNYIFEEFTPSLIQNLPKSDICNKNKVPQHGLGELTLESLQNEMYIRYNRFLEGERDIEQKRVSLYSTRHQCIANAKASKVNPFEIAAFFGHSSKETSSRHYGKAWSGWSSFTFKPSLESVRCVSGSENYLRNEQSPPLVNETPKGIELNDFTFR